MKAFKLIFFVFLSILISFPSVSTEKKGKYIEADDGPTNKKSEKRKLGCGYNYPIRVAGFVTNPPFGWVTVERIREKDEYVNNGYSFELFKSMAQKHGLRVQNVGFKSYQSAMSSLRRGRVDVVVGVYYNKHNLGIGVNLLYPSYIENPIVPIFLKGNEKKIETLADLRNFKGVVRQEEFIYPLIYKQLLSGTDLKQVSGSKTAFKKLITGEVDYVLTSLYAGEAEARRFKILDKISFSKKPLMEPSLFFAFSSVSQCLNLKSLLSNELQELKNNQQEYQKNFVSYINEWGKSFKDEPGLLDEISELKEASDVDNKTENTSSHVEDESDLSEVETTLNENG